MVIKAEQSIMIPLKACTFDQVRMRPLPPGKNEGVTMTLNRAMSDSIFDWTDRVDMCLLQDDREIFEKKPVVMVSKINQ